MSAFNNNGLGDGGLQKSIEKQRDYTQLTYEELKAKIGDALYSEEFGDVLDEMKTRSVKEWEDAHPLVDAPEGWEEKRTAELMDTVPDGSYCIDGKLWTGKGGYIQFQIAIEKYAKRYK